MKCKNCGSEVSETAKFCGVCGAKIEPEEPAPAVQETSVIKCQKCGNEVEADATFCDNCGARIEPEEPAPVVEEPAVPICPSCGNAVVEGAKFCGVCGAPLQAEEPDPVVEEPAIPTCPNCGSELIGGAKFCRMCGTPVGAEAPAPLFTPAPEPAPVAYGGEPVSTAPAPQKKSKKGLLIGIICGATALVVAAVFLVLMFLGVFATKQSMLSSHPWICENEYVTLMVRFNGDNTCDYVIGSKSSKNDEQKYTSLNDRIKWKMNDDVLILDNIVDQDSVKYKFVEMSESDIAGGKELSDEQWFVKNDVLVVEQATYKTLANDQFEAILQKAVPYEEGSDED